MEYKCTSFFSQSKQKYQSSHSWCTIIVIGAVKDIIFITHTHYTYLHNYYTTITNSNNAAEYQRVSKQCSSVIAYQAGHRLLFGNICYFVRVYNNVYAVVKVLKVLDTCHSFFNLPHYALYYNISRIVPVLATEELHVTNVATIVQKCLYVCVLPHAYICIPPNVLLHLPPCRNINADIF